MGDGAITALIFYKGLLHAGYFDGSIKVRIHLRHDMSKDHDITDGNFCLNFKLKDSSTPPFFFHFQMKIEILRFL